MLRSVNYCVMFRRTVWVGGGYVNVQHAVAALLLLFFPPFSSHHLITVCWRVCVCEGECVSVCARVLHVYSRFFFSHIILDLMR